MSCTPTPTSTQFTTVVSSLVSTSFSSLVTTLPDTTSTNVVTSCLESSAASSGASDGGGCLSSTLITSTSVITGKQSSVVLRAEFLNVFFHTGGVSTAQVPFEVSVLVTSTEATNTLFASCTDTSTTPTTTTTTTSSTSTSTSDTSTSTTSTTSQQNTSSTTMSSSSTEFTQSLTTALTTPTTTFTTSVNATLADGSVTLSLLTVTSTLPASSAVLTTSVPLASTQPNSHSGNSSSSNIGAIAGGAVGGFVGLIAIVAALWFYCRRRTNWDDLFEKDYDEYAGRVRQSRSNLLDAEDELVQRSPALTNTEPKPYVYGLVGSALAPPSLNAGVPVVNSSLSSEHGRRPSQGSLMLGNTAPSAASSRPNSFNAVPTSIEHSVGPVSTAGRRAASPGPLGVSINTGPSLSMSYPVEPPSPASIAAPVGTLFIANQDPLSRPGSPNSPVSAGSPGSKRDTGNNASGTSFAGAMAGASNNAPMTYQHLLSGTQGLQHNDSISSRSVYSQASIPLRTQSPPMPKAPSVQRRTSGIIVHTDGGRVPSEQGAPPSYSG
ncbi:hypothetical protein EW145_g2781 [Phellinidium pouzarii]|uniref:Uncharacterized protein n=1 Tax=Phellinidium pouzarii TaxID=167371 RepID=A0A4S4L9I0_9AGAM|nr:hypothetical protein EW145_g2781 [Phellinidium pouzarii]